MGKEIDERREMTKRSTFVEWKRIQKPVVLGLFRAGAFNTDVWKVLAGTDAA